MRAPIQQCLKMNDIKTVTKKLLKFRRDRDWEKFHKPKDLAISLVLEANEVLEHFQWKSEEEIEKYTSQHKEELAEELADVFNWVLLISYDLKIDIIQASQKKIGINKQKYPIKKSRSKHTKYTEL